MENMHQEEECCRGYILIKVEGGKDVEVFNKVRDLRKTYPIQEVAMLYGEYDILVNVYMSDTSQFQNFVFNELRPIKGIVDTQTIIAPKVVEFK